MDIRNLKILFFLGALAVGLSQWACSSQKQAPGPGLWQQAVSTFPTNQNSAKSPDESQATLQSKGKLDQNSLTTSSTDSNLSQHDSIEAKGSQDREATVSANSSYTHEAYPSLVENDREVYSGGRYYGASVRVTPSSGDSPSSTFNAPAENAPRATGTPSDSVTTLSSGSTIRSGGGSADTRNTANHSTAPSPSANPSSSASSSNSASGSPTAAPTNTTTLDANTTLEARVADSTAINMEADQAAPAPSSGIGISNNNIEPNNSLVPLSGEMVSGDSISLGDTSPDQPSFKSAFNVLPQAPDYEVATQTTSLALTAENAPSPSGGPTVAASGDGILGSSVEPVVLPSIGVSYVTLFGQPESFQESSIKNLDYLIWFMDEAQEQYEKIATARTYLKKIFLPDAEIPQLPDCTSKELDSGRIEVICDGKNPDAKGFMIRLISCGIPNMGLMYDVAGNAENPVADYIDRAFIMGDPDLAAKELCPERRYVDYEFGATGTQDPSEMQIRFPLETGKIYFLTQFPTDYFEKVEEYGAPVPNYLGIHNSTYPDAASLTNFLVNSRIIQVIIAAPRSGADAYGFPADQKQVSITYPRADYALEKVEPPSLTLPSSNYCQEVAQWDSKASDLELELFNRVNETRAQARSCGAEGSFEATAPLKFDPALQCAARRHSKDMTVRDFFSHYNPQGLSEFERIFFASLAPPISGTFDEMPNIFPITGENIAEGIEDPQAAIERWLESDEHCANLMSPMFTHMGMGFYTETESPAHLTLNFGTVLK